MEGVLKHIKFIFIFFAFGDCLYAVASNKEPLVHVSSINQHIKIDAALRSSKTGISRCYLRKTVACQLDLVQKELEPLGLCLKIMDAYRSLSDQKRLWKEFPNNKYVANPIHGSRHNRGAAVDLRLVRLHDGKELTMPTTKFSKDCHRNYERMQGEEMKKNCKLLELIMEKHGFIPLPTEWWHFDYKDWHVYSVLDVSFAQLASHDTSEQPKSEKKLLQSKIKKVVKNKKIRQTKQGKHKKDKKKKKNNKPKICPPPETPKKAVSLTT